MSRSTGTTRSLLIKYALALASVIAYAVVAEIAEALEGVAGFPEAGIWFHPLVGAIFGALVMAPYAGPRQRVPRGIALAAASAAIYYLAVRFVVDGAPGLDSLTSFVLAGGGAALLCSLAVIVLAPRAIDWRPLLLALVAGAVGGAAFELKFAFDAQLVIGHAGWQLLVCLALHFGFQYAPTAGQTLPGSSSPQ